MALDIVRLWAIVAVTFTALMGWLFIASRAFSATAGIGSRRGVTGRAPCMPAPLSTRAAAGAPVVTVDTSGPPERGYQLDRPGAALRRPPRGGDPHGQADLRRDRLARRLHRRCQRELRLGRARRGGAPVRQRPRAAGGHLPLRAADVRGDGGLGDDAAGVAVLGRLRVDLAGGRQDRLLDDARRRLDAAHADRAVVRPRRRAPAQGHRHPRHRRRRCPPGRPRHRRRAGGRVPPVPHARARGRGHSGPAGRRARRPSSCETSAASATA